MLKDNKKILEENKHLRNQISFLSMENKRQAQSLKKFEEKMEILVTTEVNKIKKTYNKKVTENATVKPQFNKTEKSLYNQLVETMKKVDELMEKISTLTEKMENEKRENEELKKTNEKLLLEIERLKAKNKKDSSNSSKPSSTNGFKKVITNRREKSDKNVGGQAGHQFFSLSETKVKELISDGAKVEIYEVNKNDKNKNKQYKTIKVIDIEVKTVIKEYRYYPDENGKYEIPNNCIQNITYGNNIKATTSILNHAFPNSTDGTKAIINYLTNDKIKISKGTIINWTKELAKKLQPEIKNIEEELLSSFYLNCDESGIKINGNDYNVINSSNATHTREWISKTKKHEDLEKIDFLTKYAGIIVKDGTEIYNGFGIGFSQCNSHILRYLKGIYDFVSHQGPRKMKDFLIKCENERQELKNKKINSFTAEKYKTLIKEYEEIIRAWKKEWMKDSLNPVYDDERKLLSRMEDDDKEQILYFLKNFKIPFTNNQAESDQRPVKIKQKIGKFRSETGAKDYINIRSCISTYKKNKINVFKALAEAYNNNPIIV